MHTSRVIAESVYSAVKRMGEGIELMEQLHDWVLALPPLRVTHTLKKKRSMVIPASAGR